MLADYPRILYDVKFLGSCGGVWIALSHYSDSVRCRVLFANGLF